MKSRLFISITAFTAFIILTGCAGTPKYTSAGRNKQLRWGSEDNYVLESVVGIASYYSAEFAGRPTANGEIFDPAQLTAAHKQYPFNTLIRVTNLKNNKSVIVRINDRGPFISGRIIDLSRGAALKIGMLNDGIARVKLEVLEWGEE